MCNHELMHMLEKVEEMAEATQLQSVQPGSRGTPSFSKVLHWDEDEGTIVKQVTTILTIQRVA